MRHRTNAGFLLRVLPLLLATLPGCSGDMFCAPCAACNAVGAAAPASAAPAATPDPGKEEPAAAAPVTKAEPHDGGPVAKSEAPPPASVVAAPASAKPEPPLPGGRVRSAGEYFATLKARFVPAASKGLHAVFQFDLSGRDAISCHVAVDDGAMRIEKGRAKTPHVTISATTADYVKVVNGEMGGVGAVLSRKMKVGGDLTLARKMAQIFPGGRAEN